MGAGARGGSQRVIVVAVAQLFQTGADRRIGQARDPEPLHRFATARVLGDEAKGQRALAPGTRTDDACEITRNAGLFGDDDARHRTRIPTIEEVRERASRFARRDGEMR
ncbi:MAG: hypothetical protein ACLFQI_12100 [Halochromatium sp.]|uniref:hypothetical protein n=1 Tax=Halochromatium sp. TaxID=2049430 RepID=UPI00397BDA76